MSLFRKATKTKVRLRMALVGGAGDGKTYTALRLAMAMAARIAEAQGRAARVAVISTEFGSVEKYLGEAPDGIPFDFSVGELPNFAPTSYVAAIQAAAREGYDVVVIDSLSHAWAGKDGALEQVDKRAKDPKRNSFTAWADVTPQHNALVEAINQSPIHVIATMRSKMEYVVEEYVDERGHKRSAPRKVGMAPVQRAGMEYEFDIVGELDNSHLMRITKSRCPAVDGLSVVKPGAEFVAPVWQWLNDGVDAPQPAPGSAVVPPPAAADSGDARATMLAAPQTAKPESPASTNGAARNTAGRAQNDPRNGPPVEAAPTILPPKTDPAAPLSKEQLAEIQRLVQVLAVPERVRDATFAKHKIGSWRSLTAAAADEVIGKLRSMELGFAPIPWPMPEAAAARGDSDIPF